MKNTNDRVYDQHLVNLVALKNECKSAHQLKIKRGQYIIDWLDKNGHGYAQIPISRFKSEIDDFNVFTWIPAQNKTKQTIAFAAHFDVVNPRSDNVNDNTASVVNLLNLITLLNKEPPNVNVLFFFTDLEETGGIGATVTNKYLDRLLEQYDLDFIGIINLELTAYGKAVWIEKSKANKFTYLASVIKSGIDSYMQIQRKYVNTVLTECPFSDADVFSRSYPSICIGTIPISEALQVGKKIEHKSYSTYKGKKTERVYTSTYRPSTWSICHSDKDSLSTSSVDEMHIFVNILKEMVFSI